MRKLNREQVVSNLKGLGYDEAAIVATLEVLRQDGHVVFVDPGEELAEKLVESARKAAESNEWPGIFRQDPVAVVVRRVLENLDGQGYAHPDAGAPTLIAVSRAVKS